MDDMPKTTYLAKDAKGYKLRRNVPQALRSIVGRTAWVERLAGRSYAEIRHRAALFAVATNEQLNNAKRQLALSKGQPQRKPVDEPGFIRRPTQKEVESIALAYFRKRDTEIMNAGGYVPTALLNDREERELAEETGLDLADAQRQLNGSSAADAAPGTGNRAMAMQLLIEHGFLPDGPQDEGKPTFPDAVAGDPVFEALRVYLSRADAEIASRFVEGLADRRHPLVRDQFFLQAFNGTPEVPAPIKRDPVTIGKVIDCFQEEKQKAVGSSRFSQFNVPIRALKEEIGVDTLVEDITREQCQLIADLFVTVPSHATQHYKGKTLRQAAEAHCRKHGAYAQRVSEAQKCVAVIKMIFDVAIEHEWLSKNPAERVKLVAPQKAKKFEREKVHYEAFTPAELNNIFSAPLFTGSEDDQNRFNRPGPVVHRRSRYWVPIIALFTGMRLNEILQLEQADVRQEEGIWVIAVTDEEELDYDKDVFQKRLKTAHSLRLIPVHDTLIRIGFISWVKGRGKGRLFSDVVISSVERPSLNFSKAFRTFLKSRDISEPRRKVFHSFRHTFNNALRNGGVEVELREAINGWSAQKSMDSRYGAGYKLRLLREAVNKAKYDGLEIEHLFER